MPKLTHELLSHSLEQEGYTTEILPVAPGVPYERLAVYLGTDNEEHSRWLEITIKTQLLSRKPLAALEEKEDASHCLVQFQYIFPFAVSNFSISDTARYLAFLNASIDIPGFELHEVEQVVMYRTATLIPKQQEDCQWALALVGFTLLLIDLFTSDIFHVATGQVTTNALFEKALAQIQQKS